MRPLRSGSLKSWTRRSVASKSHAIPVPASRLADRPGDAVPAGMSRDVLWSVSSSGMGGFWNESSPQVGLGFAAGVRS